MFKTNFLGSTAPHDYGPVSLWNKAAAKNFDLREQDLYQFQVTLVIYKPKKFVISVRKTVQPWALGANNLLCEWYFVELRSIY